MRENNVVGWFEIPVSDIDRAIRFYETVFDVKLERNQMGPFDMAWFPFKEDGLGAPGSLVCYKDSYKPSPDGVLIYFTAHSGDLTNELDKVEEMGGVILQDKTLINEETGYMAIFLDTEGNRIAIHSRK